MEATIKLKTEELNANLVERIKNLVGNNDDSNTSIVISIKQNRSSYMDDLLRSKAELENGENLISFTMEELEAYAIAKKP